LGAAPACGAKLVRFGRLCGPQAVCQSDSSRHRQLWSARHLEACLQGRRDGDVVSRSMLRIGRWEPRLFYEVLARLRAAAAAAAAAGQRPPVFLDIGANLGAFAVPLASAGHRVIAFEALAANLVALRRSLCRNPALGDRVLLFDRALGASAEHDCVFVSTPHNKARGVPAR